MSEVFERVWSRIEELQSAGVKPDKVVIPADDWNDVKELAEVREGEGVAGADKTLVNDVTAVWTQRISNPEIILEVRND